MTHKLLKELMTAGLTMAVMAAVACSSSPVQEDHEFSGAVTTPIREIADFVLTDQDGESYRLSEDPNQVDLIFFGYTLCPDVCPTTLAELVRVKRALGDRADDVNFIMVTVDPERDTPEVMKQRLSVFDESFVGLTGDDAELRAVWKSFGVVAKRESVGESAAGYLMAHTAYTYLVDQDMKLRVKYRFGFNPDEVAADVIQILENS
ncbi:MAG: SCO family protein [Chloroflexi bacterium]|nr:SCO family protein [Chloroflexota bacterium]